MLSRKSDLPQVIPFVLCRSNRARYGRSYPSVGTRNNKHVDSRYTHRQTHTHTQRKVLLSSSLPSFYARHPNGRIDKLAARTVPHVPEHRRWAWEHADSVIKNWTKVIIYRNRSTRRRDWFKARRSARGCLYRSHETRPYPHEGNKQQQPKSWGRPITPTRLCGEGNKTRDTTTAGSDTGYRVRSTRPAPPPTCGLIVRLARIAKFIRSENFLCLSLGPNR